MAYVYLLATSVMWGIASPVIKYTLGGVSPLTFLLYRFFISAVIAIVYLTVNKSFSVKATKQQLPTILLYGTLATTISLGALFLGLNSSTVLDLSVITSIIPLLAVIAGAVVYKEYVSSNEKFGAGLAFSGTLIAIIVPVLVGVEQKVQLTGNIFLFIYAATDIAALLLVKRLIKRKVPTGAITNLSFIAGFVTLLPFAFIGDNSIRNVITEAINLPLRYHLGVWYMAVMSGSLAYYFRNKAQQTIEVGNVGLFMYLTPIFAVPLATFWLGEKITLPFIFGSILIVIGVFIAETADRKKRRK